MKAELRIGSVDARVYVVPTEVPEADGALAWTSTTVVLAQVRAGPAVGLGWTYGPAACAEVIAELLAGVVVGRDALDVPGAFDAMVAQAFGVVPRPCPDRVAVLRRGAGSDRWRRRARFRGARARADSA